MNAALYCLFSLVTAFFRAGFVIQFRPAVVVPAVFAAAFGPWVGGVGAAIETFVASIILYGSPLLTIFSGTPGNLAGFYVLGWICKKWRGDWRIGYALANITGFLIGFTIIAGGLYFLAAVIGLEMLASWLSPRFVAAAITFGILSELPFSIGVRIPVLVALRKSWAIK